MLETRGASLRAALLSTSLVLGTGLLSGLVPSLAQAQSLPEPYVSRALDAVLLPIDAAVVSAFALDSGTTGALVLATQPGGLAEAAGFLPGDVIETVKSRKVASPIEVDEIVLYWIRNGVTDFGFDIWRGGAISTTSWIITEEYYYEVIDTSTVAGWSSYSYDSFSYESYYAEYSETITESYESSETMIEETITSEEFTSEITEETVIEEESTEEVMTEEATTETEATAEDATTEDATEAEATDEAASDEAATDEAVDEGADAAPDEATDEAGADEAGADEGGDAGGDEGGDAGGDEG